MAQLSKHFMTGFLHDACAWVVVFVDAVTEAHEAERIILVFCTCNVLRNTVNRADFGEHVESCFVCTTVGWTPQTCDTSCNTCKWVRARRTSKTYGRSGSVLLVVSVQDEDTVHSAGQNRIYFVFLTWNCEAHVQEVGCVVQIVSWVNERLANVVFVGHCSNGRHLRDHAQGSNHALVWIGDVGAVMIEGRESSNGTGHDCHWVGVTTIAFEERAHLIVDHGVVGYAVNKVVLFCACWQFAVQQQVAGFQKVAVFSELFNRVTAVKQSTCVTIDESDLGFA